MDDIQELSATALTGLIRLGKVSAKEALESHIRSIEQRNAAVNAVVTTDFERASELARAADEQTARGEETGLLHGLPMTHKDTFATQGLRTTQGSRVFEHNVPERDELVIARLAAAGVIRTGKTNVPEFGAGSHTFNDVFGTTTNPWDPTLSAGGSSGGVAAVIASRIQPLGEGSDMGGSLRIPASFCNVYGLRPSYGVIPHESAHNAHAWLSRTGPMARDVADLALFMRATVGPSKTPNPSPLTPGSFGEPRPQLAGVRIGYSFDFGIDVPVDTEVRETLAAQLSDFERAGAILEEATIDLREADEVFRVTRAFDFATSIGPLLEQHRDVIKPEVLWNTTLGLSLTGPELIAAQAARARLDIAVQQFFGAYDAFLSPAAQVLPFDATWRWPQAIEGRRADNYLSWMRSACLLSATGLPVLAMPGGFTEAGLPVGWQLAANHYRDPALLDWAAGYEEIAGVAQRSPAGVGGDR